MLISQSASQPNSDRVLRDLTTSAPMPYDPILKRFECSESLTAPGAYPYLDCSNPLQESPSSLRTSTSETSACGWELKDLESLQSLLQLEFDSTIDPNFLEIQQPYITPLMRAILLDWLMELCMEFTFKRQTFHTAISIVDRFMATVPAIQRREFQLLGVTGLYIASKLEEICVPKIQDFAKATDNGYSIEQIRAMERHILKALKWRVMPATMSHWASWLMLQWDDFISVSFGIERGSPFMFRQANEASYRLTREIYQLVDTICLDACAYKHRKPAVVAALLYLVMHECFVKRRFSLFLGQREVHMDLTHNEYAFQELLSYFLQSSLGINRLEDIFATCDYVRGFLTLELKYALPTVCRLRTREQLESHYEDFLVYQTHHSDGLAFVKAKTARN